MPRSTKQPSSCRSQDPNIPAFFIGMFQVHAVECIFRSYSQLSFRPCLGALEYPEALQKLADVLNLRGCDWDLPFPIEQEILEALRSTPDGQKKRSEKKNRKEKEKREEKTRSVRATEEEELGPISQQMEDDAALIAGAFSQGFLTGLSDGKEGLSSLAPPPISHV